MKFWHGCLWVLPELVLFWMLVCLVLMVVMSGD